MQVGANGLHDHLSRVELSCSQAKAVFVEREVLLHATTQMREFIVLSISIELGTGLRTHEPGLSWIETELNLGQTARVNTACVGESTGTGIIIRVICIVNC